MREQMAVFWVLLFAAGPAARIAVLLCNTTTDRFVNVKAISSLQVSDSV
jgi:hypothetical protein